MRKLAPLSRLTVLTCAAAIVLAACSSAGASPSAATGTARPSASGSSSGPQVVARGDFHKVDGEVAGYAQLLHLADGSFEIALEDFSIPAIEHTNVILVTNTDVTSSSDIDPKAILDLGPLKAKTGMQDFPVPTAMAASAMGYHTVVLWDTAMLHAIAAAPLKEQ